MNAHAIRRIKERISSREWNLVKQAVERAANIYGTDSLGVIAYKLKEQRNEEWGKESNGNCVLVIIRGGAVKTIYLRRDTQTFDLSVSRTDVLIDMTGAILEKPLVT
jgi:hypothetical protein